MMVETFDSDLNEELTARRSRPPTPNFKPLNAERAKHAENNSFSATLRELRV
jgi:hypothetical protein